MRRIAYDDQEGMLAWAAARIGDNRFRDDGQAIGIKTPTGDLTGVFVYDTFSKVSCQMHVASDGSKHWLGSKPRQVLIPVFSYPFVQCGFRRVTAMISEHNTRSLRFARMLGGQREGVLRKEGPRGEDMIIVGMLAEECRYTRSQLFARTGQIGSRAV